MRTDTRVPGSTDDTGDEVVYAWMGFALILVGGLGMMACMTFSHVSFAMPDGVQEAVYPHGRSFDRDGYDSWRSVVCLILVFPACFWFSSSFNKWAYWTIWACTIIPTMGVVVLLGSVLYPGWYGMSQALMHERTTAEYTMLWNALGEAGRAQLMAYWDQFTRPNYVLLAMYVVCAVLLVLGAFVAREVRHERDRRLYKQAQPGLSSGIEE